MAEKDIASKKLLEHNEIFADVSNAILFNGQKFIQPEDLVDIQSLSGYMNINDAKLHYQDRDLAKLWKKAGCIISFIGFENQTAPYSDIIFKVLGYDGAAYKSQEQERNIARKNGGIVPARYPVITIVLYYGKEPWTSPTTLYKTLGDSLYEELRPFVSDYKINVVSLRDVDIASKMSSDFGVVANEIRNRELNKQTIYKGNILYPDDLILLLRSLFSLELHDIDDSDLYATVTSEEGVSLMSYKEEGRVEGRVEGRIETVMDLILQGSLTAADGAKFLGLSENELAKKLHDREFSSKKFSSIGTLSLN